MLTIIGNNKIFLAKATLSSRVSGFLGETKIYEEFSDFVGSYDVATGIILYEFHGLELSISELKTIKKLCSNCVIGVLLDEINDEIQKALEDLGVNFIMRMNVMQEKFSDVSETFNQKGEIPAETQLYL